MTTPTDPLDSLEKLAGEATSGPWHIGHISEHEPEIMDVDGANGITVCEVYGNADSLYLCHAYPATILTLIKVIRMQREALEFYKPIVCQYGCTKNSDHDDPSWCTETCCDYGKRLRTTLTESDKLLGSIEK